MITLSGNIYLTIVLDTSNIIIVSFPDPITRPGFGGAWE